MNRLHIVKASFQSSIFIAAAAAIVSFVAGTYLARAAPAPIAQSTLSFVGTIRQGGQALAGAQKLTFKFKKGGTEICSSPPLDVTPDSSGSFQVSIPLSTCPASLFDGSVVTMDLLVGEVPVATEQPVGAVPYAKYAERVGVPDCPLGYDRDLNVAEYVVCRRGFDEMVRVGTGATTFWVDRYEASVWANAEGSGAQYGVVAPDYPIPRNGQSEANVAAYAVSKVAVAPSQVITWFQASVACRQSGKRLLRAEEWLEAARGTPDPGADGGSSGTCATQTYRLTGAGTQCKSAWGMEDAIGNYAEWIADWQGAPQLVNSSDQPIYAQWFDPTMSSDSVWAISSGSYADGAWQAGIPAAVAVGGAAWEGTGAGVFAYNAANSPIVGAAGVGLRCMIPR